MGGTDGMNVPPAVVDEDSELGQRYIAAMQLAGAYSYAGREWVVERVRKLIGGGLEVARRRRAPQAATAEVHADPNIAVLVAHQIHVMVRSRPCQAARPPSGDRLPYRT
jgi:RNA-splicing ligase RtcB